MNLISFVDHLMYKTLRTKRKQGLAEQAEAGETGLNRAKIIYLYQKKVIMPQPGKVISMFTKNDSHCLSINH